MRAARRVLATLGAAALAGWLSVGGPPTSQAVAGPNDGSPAATHSSTAGRAAVNVLTQPALDLRASPTTQVTAAAPIDPGGSEGAFSFPGWTVAYQGAHKALVPDRGIDGILASGPNDYFAHPTVPGNDLGDNGLDPGDGSLTVRAWVQPLNPDTFPRSFANVGLTNGTSGGRTGLTHVSPNILQKGLPGATTQGAYKMSLLLYNYGTAASPDLRWQPFCSFRGQIVHASGAVNRKQTLRTTKMGAAQARLFKMDNDTPYEISCELASNGAVSVRVQDTSGATVYQDTAAPSADESHLRVFGNRQFFVGSKPATTDATDVFAGVIDSVTIETD